MKEAYSCLYFGSYAVMASRHDEVPLTANALSVACPKCGVTAGSWCRRPNGTLYEVLHNARWLAAPDGPFLGEIPQPTSADIEAYRQQYERTTGRRAP